MNKKHIEIAKKLIEQSNNRIFTVISDSMSPLIRKGDRIICNAVDIDKIKKYSLIAFNNDLNNKSVPTVHRVIKILKTTNGIALKTKGDLNPICDKTYVTRDSLIGIVSKITGDGKTISFDSFSGKTLSILLYFISNFNNYFKLIMLKSKKIFNIFIMPEKQPDYKNDLKIIHQSILINTRDWTNTAKINTDLLKHFINKETEICDISFDCGYCEESFHFIRQNFKIECMKISSVTASDKKYDIVICSKVLNLAENKQKRQEIYGFIKQILKKDGYILLSYINKKNNFMISLKRQIFSLSKIYNGPKKDDLIYNGFFVMKHLNGKNIKKELADNDFLIEKRILSDNTVSLVLKLNLK